jgi:hypothetical protein
VLQLQASRALPCGPLADLESAVRLWMAAHDPLATGRGTAWIKPRLARRGCALELESRHASPEWQLGFIGRDAGCTRCSEKKTSCVLALGAGARCECAGPPWHGPRPRGIARGGPVALPCRLRFASLIPVSLPACSVSWLLTHSLRRCEAGTWDLGVVRRRRNAMHA